MKKSLLIFLPYIIVLSCNDTLEDTGLEDVQFHTGQTFGENIAYFSFDDKSHKTCFDCDSGSVFFDSFFIEIDSLGIENLQFIYSEEWRSDILPYRQRLMVSFNSWIQIGVSDWQKETVYATDSGRFLRNDLEWVRNDTLDILYKSGSSYYSFPEREIGIDRKYYIPFRLVEDLRVGWIGFKINWNDVDPYGLQVTDLAVEKNAQ